MKLFLVALFFYLILFSVNSFAQENEIPNSEIPSSVHPTEVVDDKPLLFEHEIKASRKDTIQTKIIPALQTKIKSEQSKPGSGKEEDALSFNFLYYIIQKFKISDLVDN